MKSYTIVLKAQGYQQQQQHQQQQETTITIRPKTSSNKNKGSCLPASSFDQPSVGSEFDECLRGGFVSFLRVQQPTSLRQPNGSQTLSKVRPDHKAGYFRGGMYVGVEDQVEQPREKQPSPFPKDAGSAQDFMTLNLKFEGV